MVNNIGKAIEFTTVMPWRWQFLQALWGGAGCHSYLYLVDMKEKKMKPVGNIETLNGCKQKQGYFVYLPNEYAVTILTKASGMSGAGGGVVYD